MEPKSLIYTKFHSTNLLSTYYVTESMEQVAVDTNTLS